MAHLQLSFLGSPEVRYGQRLLTFATRKALALLVYLAVEGGVHSREKLVAFFWPESDSIHGRGALRTTLAHLRRGFDTAIGVNHPAYLLVEADAVGFNFQSDFHLDLHDLAAALEGEANASLPNMVHAWRGNFLAGFTLPEAPVFENWAMFQREYWHHRMSIGFDRLLQWQSAQREFEEGVATAVRWLAHDPLNEAAHRGLMQLHFLAGNKSAALQAYKTCQEVLAHELAIKPSPETKALADRIYHTQAKAQNLQTPTRQWVLPFIGRVADHGQLAAIYQAVCRGKTQVVLLEGEAGMGKTRLATEFLAWTAVHGADVLTGCAFEAGGRLPYQPVVDALRPRLERENAPEDLLTDVWLAELSRLLPELRDRYPDLPLSLAENEQPARTRLLEAVARLGQALSTRAPVILFIDDIQWADTASLDALHYGCRVWDKGGNPVLLLLAVRTEALSTTPSINDWLSGLRREVTLTRLLLNPITAVDTQQLAQTLAGQKSPLSPHTLSDPPPWFAQWLFDETAGQPFYITEMIKTLLENGLLHLHLTGQEGWNMDWQMAAPPFGIIPPGVRELILGRLRRLTPNAAALLTAAAVIGRTCRLERLCQVVDLPLSTSLVAFDELVAAHLLRETDNLTRPYTLAHDKIRDVVYTEAGVARRGLYHQRAFTGLEAIAAPPAELAYHALAAGLNEPAIRYSIAAGDAAMSLFAVHDAVAHYEQAHRQLTRVNYQPPAFNLYLGLGRAYELMGEYEQGQGVYQELLELAQVLDQSEMACLALNRLGTLAIHAYAFETAVTWLQQALTLAQASGHKTILVETEWSLAQLAYHTFDYPTTIHHSQQALTLARELEDQTLIAGSLNTLAYAEMLLGQVNDSRTHMEEAKSLYAAMGNRALEADSLTIIALAKIWQGEVATAIEDARLAHTISHKIDNPWGQISSGNVLALGLMEKGHYDEALTIAQQGKQQAQRYDLVLVTFLNLLITGMVHRAMLSLEAARTTHEEAAALSARTGSPAFAEMTAAQLCADYALAGDWETAAKYARQGVALRQYNALPLVIPPLWLETEALLRGRDVDLARQNCQQWGKLVGHIPRYRLLYLHSLALLSEWDGFQAQAVAQLEAAYELAKEIGLLGEQWPILLKLAQLYSDAHQQAAARRDAAEIIHHLHLNAADFGMAGKGVVMDYSKGL